MRAAIELVRRVHRMPGGSERLDQVWYYCFKVSELGPVQVRDLLATLIDPRAGTDVMTTADRIEQKVREEFMQERAATMLRLVEKRFGPVPETTRDRIGHASKDELDRWLDRILDAPSIDALLAD